MDLAILRNDATKLKQYAHSCGLDLLRMQGRRSSPPWNPEEVQAAFEEVGQACPRFTSR